ncbi:MAG: hypothetical protein WC807_09645 [Hyphomicrobium sp.]|jgi:hypothetical protein
MLRNGQLAPPVVYLLADNLDTALAAGEDLQNFSLSWQSGDARLGEDLAACRAEEREAIEAARALEMVLVARVLKSRESAAELAKSEPHLRPIAKLYTAGTALLADAIGELGDDTKQIFDSGDGKTAYLRSRGLIAEDAAAPAEAEALAVTDAFLVCGRVPLGALMDLVSTVLDTLETHYSLYGDAGDEVSSRSVLPATANDGTIEVSV